MARRSVQPPNPDAPRGRPAGHAGRRTRGRRLDLSRSSRGSSILLIAGSILIVDLFLPWERAPTVALLGEAFGGDALLGISGAGILLFAFVVALVAWEAALVAGKLTGLGRVSPAAVAAALGAATLVVGIIRFVDALTGLLYGPAYGAWIGLVLLAAVGYGAYVRFRERRAADGPAT